MFKRLKITRLALLLAILTTNLNVLASEILNEKTITFSYWDQASPPIAFQQENELTGGIIKDLGDAIGEHLKMQVSYIKLPVARIEPYLKSGQIDADCITSSIWKETPELYNWSPKLFDGADRILVRKDDQRNIQEFEDLKNLRLGTYIGYVYHPQIMKMIENKTITPVKVSDIEKGIRLLQLGRIDVLIDFGISLRYQMLSKTLHNELSLAEKHADNFELSCAYSKKSTIPSETMDQAIHHLIKSGKISDILNKYR